MSSYIAAEVLLISQCILHENMSSSGPSPTTFVWGPPAPSRAGAQFSSLHCVNLRLCVFHIHNGCFYHRVTISPSARRIGLRRPQESEPDCVTINNNGPINGPVVIVYCVLSSGECWKRPTTILHAVAVSCDSMFRSLLFIQRLPPLAL